MVLKVFAGSAAVLLVAAVIAAPRKQRLPKYTSGSDPEEHMTTPEIIEHWGYPSEIWDVTTADGYILTMHRIPHGKDDPDPTAARPAILMQHGLECSSSNWVTNLPWESAGFMFADAGYDVWLGNMRGNAYSTGHLNMTEKDKDFWRFSYDEMAQYDLPAMVDFMRTKTGNDQIYYMGHSQGTMIMFAHAGTNPDFEQKIKKFFALAPVAKVGHIGGLLSWIAPFTYELGWILEFLGDFPGQFLPADSLLNEVAEWMCGLWITSGLCDDVLFLIAGADSDQLNQTRVPVYVAHTPAGTSTQDIVHFGQGVNSDVFQMYNYDPYEFNGNKKHYGQDTPPMYDVSNIQIPTYIYRGDKDILADPTDVDWIASQLSGSGALVQNVELADFNHLDFIWGLNAAGQIYMPIIEIMKADQAAEQRRSSE